MPMHDWMRSGDWVFADFRLRWLAETCRALNHELLPDPYYALIEWVGGHKQHKRVAVHRQPDDEIIAVVDIMSLKNKLHFPRSP